jgi:hypothetical protein
LIPDEEMEIVFNLHNPSGRTTAMGVHSTSNRNEYQKHFSGGKVRAALKANNFTAI